MFEITGIDVSGALKTVVMATGFENPLSLINGIETKFSALLGSETTDEILFDLLCTNSPEWNHFVTLEMKYGRIMLDTTRIIDEQNVPIHTLSKLTFTLRNHPEYLETSILSPDDIRQVLLIDF